MFSKYPKSTPGAQKRTCDDCGLARMREEIPPPIFNYGRPADRRHLAIPLAIPGRGVPQPHDLNAITHAILDRFS